MKIISNLEGKIEFVDEEKFEIRSTLNAVEIEKGICRVIICFNWFNDFIGYIYGYHGRLGDIQATNKPIPLAEDIESNKKDSYHIDYMEPDFFVETINFCSDIVISPYFDKVMELAGDMLRKAELDFGRFIYSNLMRHFDVAYRYGTESEYIEKGMIALWNKRND